MIYKWQHEFSPPQPFEPHGISSSIADGMLDVPVPEIILNQPGIRALVDEDIAVTARRVVTFKPGQKLKRTVCSQSNS